jgi:hypothetical protein
MGDYTINYRIEPGNRAFSVDILMTQKVSNSMGAIKAQNQQYLIKYDVTFLELGERMKNRNRSTTDAYYQRFFNSMHPSQPTNSIMSSYASLNVSRSMRRWVVSLTMCSILL